MVCGRFVDQQWIASGSNSRTLRLFDLTTKTNREFKVAHTETVISGVFSPDSRTLATGCTDGTLVVWEVANGVPLRDLNTAGGGVASLAFSPDGRLLVAGNNDGTVQVWDPSLGVEIHSF